MQISKLNIVYIEPFYSGSHKRWIDSYKLYSKHNIEILGLRVTKNTLNTYTLLKKKIWRI